MRKNKTSELAVPKVSLKMVSLFVSGHDRSDRLMLKTLARKLVLKTACLSDDTVERVLCRINQNLVDAELEFWDTIEPRLGQSHDERVRRLFRNVASKIGKQYLPTFHSTSLDLSEGPLSSVRDCACCLPQMQIVKVLCLAGTRDHICNQLCRKIRE